jgi:hypothetical protein
LLQLTGSVGARPSDDPDTAEARRHFQRGLAHYNLYEYKDAITEFEAAYRLHPDPSILYNLGQSYRLSNQPDEALKFYKTYLREAAAPPNRREVESRIADLEKLVEARQRTATPPDTPLQPRDASMAKIEARPRHVEAAPPPHVEASPPPHVELAPPAHDETPPLAVTAPIASAPAPVERRATPAYKKWWLWTIVGVVVVGAAVGVGVGVSQSSGSRFANTYPGVSF